MSAISILTPWNNSNISSNSNSGAENTYNSIVEQIATSLKVDARTVTLFQITPIQKEGNPTLVGPIACSVAPSGTLC